METDPNSIFDELVRRHTVAAYNFLSGQLKEANARILALEAGKTPSEAQYKGLKARIEHLEHEISLLQIENTELSYKLGKSE